MIQVSCDVESCSVIFMMSVRLIEGSRFHFGSGVPSSWIVTPRMGCVFRVSASADWMIGRRVWVVRSDGGRV